MVDRNSTQPKRKNAMSEIQFLGGAGTVTGSKFLVKVRGHQILIDCGLFQGAKEHRLLNRQPLPVKASEIDAVVLTHAHLDHTGYLPVIVKDGFAGPIYASAPTIELTKIILRDSAKIQMEDAEFANDHHFSKHSPALPLYNSLDAERVFPLFRPISSHEWITLIPNIAELRFSNSGHILGSTLVELKINGKIVAFSGDLGREKPILLHPRELISVADTLILESTYGDRCHSTEDQKAKLESIINRTFHRGGTVLIPAFAIGRTQEILYLLKTLLDERKIPQKMPIYLDSPMGNKATEVFDQFPAWHTLQKTEIQSLGRLFHHVSSASESFELCKSKTPAIVIAGSGMLNGGRIRHHLASRISDEKNEIVLVGYQAAGTPGRFLQERTEELKLFGEYRKVNIQISELHSLSAHADQGELIRWVQGFKSKPKKVFLVHGETQALEGLRVRLGDAIATPITVAKMEQSYPLFLET